MQVAFETLTTDWTQLSEIAEIETDVTYYIQNRGPHDIIALESYEEPSDESGNIVRSGEALVYKQGEQQLYLRAFSATAQINITKEG